jgi:hypothetical protein
MVCVILFPMLNNFKYLFDYSEIVAVAPLITGFTLVRIFSVSSFWSHIFLLKYQLFYIHFPFHYHGLWLPVYCNGRCCCFIILNSTMRLSYCSDLFLLNFLHANTGDHSNFTRIYLHMLKCSSALTLMHLYVLCFANIKHVDIMPMTVQLAYSKITSISVWHQQS